MKGKIISFEDRINSLIYQIYEFSEKTSKYDYELLSILLKLCKLREDLTSSKKEHINRFYDIENGFHKIEMDYKFNL